MFKTLKKTRERVNIKMKKLMITMTAFFVLLFTVNEKTEAAQHGIASYYANFFNGRRTANGEIFSNNKVTAAHKTLPLGTKVKVTNKTNGKSIVVRINDRGPYVRGRVIDLSRKAFTKIGNVNKGLLDVKVEVLS